MSISSTRKRLIVALLFVFCTIIVALSRFELVGKANTEMAPSARQTSSSLGSGASRQLRVAYRGNAIAVQTMRSGQAQPKALASADLNGDAAPDLIAGYSSAGAGIVTIQQGNTDAFAPKDDSVFERMQKGYNPDSLLPETYTYLVPEGVDFLQVGDFNHDNRKDVLVATRGGGMYLLPGDGHGGLGESLRIDLPGTVTAMTAGEFRAADGWTDAAVAIVGAAGPALLVFDGQDGILGEPITFRLNRPATSLQIDALDSDPYRDIAVADGSEVDIVHGWGRKQEVDPQMQIERIDLGANALELATGFFVWSRAADPEIAVLMDDGSIRILNRGEIDERPFTDSEIQARARSRMFQVKQTIDVENVRAWRPEKGLAWGEVRKIAASRDTANAAWETRIQRSHISYGQTDDLIMFDGASNNLAVIGQTGESAELSNRESDMAAKDIAVEDVPVSASILPQKLNGERSLVIMRAGNPTPLMITLAPTATISVDRTDDPAITGPGVGAAACTATVNDCSLRGAVEFANANPGTTINLGSNTYTLNTNGAGGCVNENTTTGNHIGDLEINATTTIVGAGAASTIINQIGVGSGANTGDRVLCMDVTLAPGFTYSFSGLTIAGGRDVNSNVGGGGVIGGARNTTLNLTNVTVANNQSTGPNISGGGGVAVTGGDMNVTGCTFGGANLPGASRTDLTLGNAVNSNSGGGLSYSAGDPLGVGGATGTLTLGTTTFTHNTASSGAAGGGAMDVFDFNTSAGTYNISTSSFISNQATVANGGAIVNESAVLNISSTSFTNNSAANRGGAIYVAGGLGTTLNGTSPSIVFSGNTATNGGSSVSTAGTVTVTGTNTTIGGDIEITTNGIWTNNPGSALNPNNIVLNGGILNCNDTTMNLTGDFTLGHEATHGFTFNGNTGTINIAGNLSVDFANGGSGALGSFNAGTNTFNFNGTGSQSISNTAALTFNNLTDSNTTQPLTLNNSVGVGGNLNVNGAGAILAPVAGAIISGAGTLTGTGTARVTRTAATPDFLSQYTISNKTLTSLTVDYAGLGNQTVNNSPSYGNLRISGTGTKSLQGTTNVGGSITLAAATLDVTASNFGINVGGNWTNSGGAFTPGSGTVTFNGTSGTQLLSGNTSFYNLTLANSGATTDLGSGTTTIQNTLSKTAGSITGGSGTIIFTGVAGSIIGVGSKQFNNLQINNGASISNTTGGNLTIQKDFTNSGTFTQGSALTTTFDATSATHSFSGGGTTTFGGFTINNSTTVDAGSHSFNVVGSTFSSTGTFTGNASTVTFNGAVAQSITGNGAKNFSGLTINNANGVTLNNGTGAVDASVGGLLTLTTDLTVASGAVLQQSGTSTGAGDVVGTVRRTDLGGTARSFGNLNNSVQINSGTAPTQMDVTLVKSAPSPFPAGIAVVPRTYTLTPTGGSGISASLKLRYIDPAELSGITESKLILWKKIGSTWTPQGGTDDATNNFVSLAGVSGFSDWAIAEGPDLTISKSNDVSNAAVTGQTWTWTVTVNNTGGASADFASGQTILTDNLPNSANISYGTPTPSDPNMSCSIDGSKDLTCTAGASGLSIAASGSVNVQFTAVAGAGTYQNPRAAGNTQVDPGGVIAESNEANNTAANNTVTVTKANTTASISNDTPDPTAVGEAYTVTASVSVTLPGSATPIAPGGTITISDGTNTCPIVLPATSCMLTSTTPGSKSLTATYGGDTNFNASPASPTAPHTVFGPPTISKSFSPGTIVTGQTSTLNIVIASSAANPGTLNGIAFTDTLPAGITAPNSGPTAVCGGSVSVASNVVSFSGGSLSPNTNCTVPITVTGVAASASAYVNTINSVSSTNGGTNNTPASGNITVNKAATTASISSDTPDPTSVGESYTVTASISVTSPGSATPTTPTGTITISDGTDTCPIVLPATSCLLTSTTPGAKNLTATYGGDTNFSASPASPTVPHTVLACLSNPIVTLNTDTNVVGDLRYALANVCAAPNNNITFNLGAGAHTITTGSSLVIAKDVTITNTLSGSNGPVSVNGDGTFRIFEVDSPVTSATLSGFTISGGSDTSANGGGGLLAQSGTVTLNGMLLTGNHGSLGGGATVAGGATLNVYDSTASANTAVAGAGLENLSSTLVLLNSTITNNTASAFGGGVHSQQLSMQPVPTTTARNTIISGNNAPTQPDVSGTAIGDLGNNIIGTAAGLGTLANNGGLTFTHALAATSPAIDAGDNAAATAAGLTTDQRGAGFPRFGNTTVDIGAYETNFALTATGGASQSTAITTNFGTNLQVTLTESGVPVNGVLVTFTAPGSGPSATFPGGNTATTNASGIASVQAAANGLGGTYQVTANISPALTVPATFDLTNSPASSSTGLTSNANPAAFGQTVTFTATVTSATAGTPTGTVTFLDGATPICSNVMLVASSAQCATAALSTGPHTISAQYSGDTNFSSSNGNLTGNPQVISQSDSTTTVVSNHNPSVFGQTVTFTATVAASGLGMGTPGGSVTFYDGPIVPGNIICNAVMLAGGTATCMKSNFTVGSHTINAAYSGDTNFTGSNAGLTAGGGQNGNPQVVDPADTVTTIISDNPDSSAVGQNVTVNFTVAASLPGVGTPGGTVTITASGGSEMCSGGLDGFGAGSCMVALTVPGSRTLTATYGATTNFNGSTDTEPHTVVAPPVISKAFSPTSVQIGNTSTLTFTITNPGANTVSLSGVGFTDTFPNAPNLVVANPPTPVLTNCGAGVLKNDTGGTLTAGDPGVQLSGATVAVGTPCTVSVNVTPVAAGPFNNVSGKVTSTNGGDGNTATATLSTSTPVLAVAKTHTDTFTQGSTATWNIQVTNNGLTAADITSGTTTVSDTFPAGYTLNSYTGTGWSCSGTSTATCTSSQAVAGAGGTFNALTLTVNIPANSAVSISNTAKAFGGGDPVHTNLASAASGSDSVTVVQVPTSIQISAGNNQTAMVNTAFGTNLAVIVKDAGNVVINGATVTFTAPAAGASGIFTAGTNVKTAVTNVSGIATATTFTANSTVGGPYTVVASINSLTTNFSLTNIAGPATHFSITAPATATAGTSFNFTVTALDAGNNIAAGYTGTVHFTSTDNSPAALPANATLVDGVGTFGSTMFKAGVQTIGAYDTVNNSIAGTSNDITVGPGVAYSLKITAPANVMPGVPFNFTVTGVDAYGNTGALGTGNVHFTSTDGLATLPADAQLVNGSGTFSATLRTPGGWAISAADVSLAISGSSNNINVASLHFAVVAPATATQGTAFSFTVTAQDLFNNTAAGYTGMVHFTSTDGSATLPGDATLTNGVGTFNATLRTIGTQTITATDTNAPVTGTSNGINVQNPVTTGVKARADFDGDGKTDISVFRPSSGIWFVSQSTGGYSGVQWGVSTDVIIPGDYDGDGKADYAVWRPTAAVGVADFYILNSNGFTVSGYEWGLPGDIPMTGDYDGDGKTDIAVYRPSETMWYIRKSQTGSADSFQFGAAGDVPLVMDFNGDGKTDLAVFRPGDRTWYMANASGTPAQTFTALQWGLATDILVPADYDGDGKDDVAVFRPSDGTWYIHRSTDGSTAYVPFGMSGDIPVPGDYDGDGKADIAVYRPSTSIWFILRSTAGFTAVQFGTAEDRPVPNAFVH